MLVQRRRRWTSIYPALCHNLIFQFPMADHKTTAVRYILVWEPDSDLDNLSVGLFFSILLVFGVELSSHMSATTDKQVGHRGGEYWITGTLVPLISRCTHLALPSTTEASNTRVHLNKPTTICKYLHLRKKQKSCVHLRWPRLVSSDWLRYQPRPKRGRSSGSTSLLLFHHTDNTDFDNKHHVYSASDNKSSNKQRSQWNTLTSAHIL